MAILTHAVVLVKEHENLKKLNLDPLSTYPMKKTVTIQNAMKSWANILRCVLFSGAKLDITNVHTNDTAKNKNAFIHYLRSHCSIFISARSIEDNDTTCSELSQC